jgi:hypothetical protein
MVTPTERKRLRATADTCGQLGGFGEYQFWRSAARGMAWTDVAKANAKPAMATILIMRLLPDQRSRLSSGAEGSPGIPGAKGGTEEKPSKAPLRPFIRRQLIWIKTCLSSGRAHRRRRHRRHRSGDRAPARCERGRAARAPRLRRGPRGSRLHTRPAPRRAVLRGGVRRDGGKSEPSRDARPSFGDVPGQTASNTYRT